MDDDMENVRMEVVDRLRPFLKDDDSYGRMHADLRDLVEASKWLISELKKRGESPMNRDSAEDFLIELDVHFVQHATFHIKSLKNNIARTLEHLAEPDI